MKIRIPVFEEAAHFPVTERDAFGGCIDRGNFVVRPLPAVAKYAVQPDVVRLRPVLWPVIRIREGASARMHFSVRILPRRARIKNFIHLYRTFVGPAGQCHALSGHIQFHRRDLAQIIGQIISMAAELAVIGDPESCQIGRQYFRSCLGTDDTAEYSRVSNRNERRLGKLLRT
ncbi:hypothetical protein D3C75_590490 [compost metagenome]